MNYKEYIPTDELKPFLDTFWISTNFDQAIESRILPDGCVDIIFDLDQETPTDPENMIRVSGMMTKYKKIVSKKNSETLGIRFKAGHFNAISNIPLSKIKNKAINASEIFPKLNYSILEELVGKNNPFEKIQLINNFLITEINWSNTNLNSLELSVCESIRSSFKEINLAKIAQDHFISLRQLERRFKTVVGVTMKEYHSIIRFNKTIKSISKDPNSSLLSIAFDNGYFDHSHLTKEINRMSGLNPSVF